MLHFPPNSLLPIVFTQINTQVELKYKPQIVTLIFIIIRYYCYYDYLHNEISQEQRNLHHLKLQIQKCP